MEPEDWKRLVGDPIRERRGDLKIKSMRMAAKRAGFTEAVWRQLESGRRQIAKEQFVAPTPTPDTQAAACRVLGWSSDSIQRLLRGEPPQVVETTDPGPAMAVADQLDAAAAVISEGLAALENASRILREQR